MFRQADRSALAAALQDSRRDTLATFAATGAVPVPQRRTLNPALWELGHIGWFQEFWTARNPQLAAGVAADPDAPRAAAPMRANADALYDSSHVPHAGRWSLPLPDADATCADLGRQLDRTLTLLHAADDSDAALYVFRLVLAHEDMHHEAALYMGQALGIATCDPRWQPAPLPGPRRELAFGAGWHVLGHDGAGFAFDNELPAHAVDLPAVHIDSRVVSWGEYLPCIEAGAVALPPHLRRGSGAWQQWRHGRWTALDPRHAACHLGAADAEAWCRWAGRRLPTEAEWERAAVERPGDFDWGQVWEWTASPFEAYPGDQGFVAHPYRDYSQPWFGGSRRVLRGVSFMTQPRLRDARYRNFFEPQRSDVAAGFRSCRL